MNVWFVRRLAASSVRDRSLDASVLIAYIGMSRLVCLSCDEKGDVINYTIRGYLSLLLMLRLIYLRLPAHGQGSTSIADHIIKEISADMLSPSTDPTSALRIMCSAPALG